MRVLGIDPGSETLGWGVVDGVGSRYVLVAFGTVKSKPRQQFSKRLLNIYEAVADIIVDHSPDVLSVEDTFYAVNAQVALKLGQVRGAMLLLAEQRGIEIAEYAPRLIKQTVVGYGNAEKQQVGQMVKLVDDLLALDRVRQALWLLEPRERQAHGRGGPRDRSGQAYSDVPAGREDRDRGQADGLRVRGDALRAAHLGPGRAGRTAAEDDGAALAPATGVSAARAPAETSAASARRRVKTPRPGRSPWRP